MFGIYNRSGTQNHADFGVGSEIVDASEAGDCYTVSGNAGGGGGHTLHVNNLEIVIE